MIEQKISELIENTLNKLGFDLVKVTLQGSGSYKALEVLIDRLDGQKISVGDCKLASNNISAILDVEDVISGKYYLEVGSAGIERPLVKIADYERFLGHEIKIRLKEKLNGSGHYRGKISKVDNEIIHLDCEDGQQLAVNLNLVKSARLVFTDEMFKQILNKQ